MVVSKGKKGGKGMKRGKGGKGTKPLPRKQKVEKIDDEEKPEIIPDTIPEPVVITMGGFELPKRRTVPPKPGVIFPSGPVRRKVPPKAAPLPCFSDDDEPPTTAPSTTLTTTSTMTTATIATTASSTSSSRVRKKPVCNPLPPEVWQDDPHLPLHLTVATVNKPPSPEIAVAAGCVAVLACVSPVPCVDTHPLPIFSLNEGDEHEWELKIETPVPRSNSRCWKKKKKKAKPVDDCFPTDGSHLTVANPVTDTGLEVDVFRENWQCFDSMRPQFKVSSHGAEQSSFLILDSRRSGHSPQPVYSGVWGADDSDDDEPGIQYDDVLMTSELIGRGAQGSVLKCYHRKTHKPLAMKKIDLNMYKKDQLCIEAQGKQIARELSMLFAHHESQHLVKSYNAFYRSNCLLLLFEYMDWSLERLRDTVLKIPPEKLQGITAKTMARPSTKKPKRRHAEDKRVEPKQPPQYMPIGATQGLQRFESSTSSMITSSASLEEADGSSNGGSPRSPSRKKKPGSPKHKRGTPIPERVITVIAHQILLGLTDLHSLKYGVLEGVVHKDIKPGNILINMNGKVKIADFGCCSFMNSTGSVPNTPFNVGTQAYMAPERHANGEYCASADIWALGVSLLELACGCHPVPSKRTGTWHVFQEPSHGNLPLDLIWPDDDYVMSKGFRDFLEACLRVDPSARPTAEELLGYEIFQFEFDPSRLALWVQKAMEYEQKQRTQESRLEAKKISRSLTENITATERDIMGYSHVSSMAWKQFGPFSASLPQPNPNDLDAFPPLGVTCKKEIFSNFPQTRSQGQGCE
eukprot:TRINITY_DN4463_c3_g1_i1.p1 TRINITY_DN4463_c3_g1~~TRINITY_DN4463_c3_g1_i1.p1  ORF type:complete len:802 (+),score=138.11 TRINITY_DN4463_c3_g1_i1:139-2544(+)